MTIYAVILVYELGRYSVEPGFFGCKQTNKQRVHMWTNPFLQAPTVSQPVVPMRLTLVVPGSLLGAAEPVVPPQHPQLYSDKTFLLMKILK